MEMSQTGFSAHSSKVSPSPVIYIWRGGGFPNYARRPKRLTVNPVNQTETVSHLRITAEFRLAAGLPVYEGRGLFCALLCVCECEREFMGRFHP